SDLGAMMPAHIIYDQVDDKPAGFSSIWLQEILRQQLNFNGVIFSDDLSMEGAAAAGSFTDRADAALSAGCDMILVCNNRDAALQVLQHLKGYKQDEVSKARIEQLAMKEKPSGLKNLKKTEKWQQLSLKLENFEELFK
ncbi:MAG: beta-N-acetylhexosaminidase, partial [Gammaproteobacteria bacterium]|nr:beta-N-acetylhexosaminidase [Gammaproteobacteria bacterium]